MQRIQVIYCINIVNTIILFSLILRRSKTPRVRVSDFGLSENQAIKCSAFGYPNVIIAAPLFHLIPVMHVSEHK